MNRTNPGQSQRGSRKSVGIAAGMPGRVSIDNAHLAVRPREAAAMLGMSVSSLERLTKAGRIPRIKDGNKVFYRVATLDEWLAKRETFE